MGGGAVFYFRGSVRRPVNRRWGRRLPDLARGIITFMTAASGQLRSSRRPMRSGRIGSRISLISPSVSDGTRLG
jgi:hypothetical protein